MQIADSRSANVIYYTTCVNEETLFVLHNISRNDFAILGSAKGINSLHFSYSDFIAYILHRKKSSFKVIF